MNLLEKYWVFEKHLSNEFCDNLIKYALKQEKKVGVTKPFENKKLSIKDKKFLKKIRHSDIVWLNEEWVYEAIVPLITAANKNAKWNFDIDWYESAQFTIYGKNQHYSWHRDSFPEPYVSSDINFNGKIRKLSVTCSLSDPSDYTGGKLQFSEMDTFKKEKITTCDEILPRGSVVVFPSHMWHTVTPVTKGTRYSLVIWALGKPFR
jgi:PKHD-type hydroxylase